MSLLSPLPSSPFPSPSLPSLPPPSSPPPSLPLPFLPTCPCILLIITKTGLFPRINPTLPSLSPPILRSESKPGPRRGRTSSAGIRVAVLDGAEGGGGREGVGGCGDGVGGEGEWGEFLSSLYYLSSVTRRYRECVCGGVGGWDGNGMSR